MELRNECFPINNFMIHKINLKIPRIQCPRKYFARLISTLKHIYIYTDRHNSVDITYMCANIGKLKHNEKSQ